MPATPDDPRTNTMTLHHPPPPVHNLLDRDRDFDEYGDADFDDDPTDDEGFIALCENPPSWCRPRPRVAPPSPPPPSHPLAADLRHQADLMAARWATPFDDAATRKRADYALVGLRQVAESIDQFAAAGDPDPVRRAVQGDGNSLMKCVAAHQAEVVDAALLERARGVYAKHHIHYERLDLVDYFPREVTEGHEPHVTHVEGNRVPTCILDAWALPAAALPKVAGEVDRQWQADLVSQEVVDLVSQRLQHPRMLPPPDMRAAVKSRRRELVAEWRADRGKADGKKEKVKQPQGDDPVGVFEAAAEATGVSKNGRRVWRRLWQISKGTGKVNASERGVSKLRGLDISQRTAFRVLKELREKGFMRMEVEGVPATKGKPAVASVYRISHRPEFLGG